MQKTGDFSDYLVSGLSSDGRFRVLAVRTTALVEEARRRHRASRTGTAALGRVLTGAVLMAGTLDEDQSVTLRFLGNGPGGGIIAEARNEGDMITARGYMGDPSVELPLSPQGKLDVGGVVGKDGFLYVTKDLGLKELYTGSAKIQSGEVGLDIAYYYTVSEQLPSAVSIGVRVGGTVMDQTGAAARYRPGELGTSEETEDGRRVVSGAGGLMVQLMPGGEEEETGAAISKIQDNLERMGSVSLLIQEGRSPEQLVEAAFEGVMEVNLMRKVPVTFSCRCSRDRAVSAIVSMGREEVEKLADEKDEIEVRCHFCNEIHRFSCEELREIARSLGDTASGNDPRSEPDDFKEAKQG